MPAWKAEAHILKPHRPFNRRQGNLGLICLARFLGGVDHIGEPLEAHPQLLDALPDIGEAQQRLGDIAGNDPEGDQLAQGELPSEHHRRPHPEHQQLGEFLQHLARFIERRAGDRFFKGARDVFAVALLPLPAAHHLHVLGLHRLDAGEHLHKMALGVGVFLRRLAKLPPEQGRPQHGEPHLDRQHHQGHQGEGPAINRHHHDVDHREGRIQHRREGRPVRKLRIFSSSAMREPSSPTGRRSK